MKAEIKFLIQWLETASEQQILQKKDQYVQHLDRTTDPDLKRFIRFSLRLIDEELLARAELLRAGCQ